MSRNMTCGACSSSARSAASPSSASATIASSGHTAASVSRNSARRLASSSAITALSALMRNGEARGRQYAAWRHDVERRAIAVKRMKTRTNLLDDRRAREVACTRAVRRYVDAQVSVRNVRGKVDRARPLDGSGDAGEQRQHDHRWHRRVLDAFVDVRIGIDLPPGAQIEYREIGARERRLLAQRRTGRPQVGERRAKIHNELIEQSRAGTRIVIAQRTDVPKRFEQECGLDLRL